MGTKFLFFDFKRNWITNIIIAIELVFCMNFLLSFIGIINFQDLYKYRYEKYFIQKQMKMLDFSEMATSIPDNKKYEQLLKVLDNNKIEYGILRQYNLVKFSDLDSKLKKIKNNFKDALDKDDGIFLKEANYTYLNNLKDNIYGNINEEQWNNSLENPPIILGNDYNKDYTIGDYFTINNKRFIIKGFFKKGVMIFTYSNPVNYSELVDNQIFIPLNNKNDIEKFNCQPIILYNLEDKDNFLINQLNKIFQEVKITELDKELNVFMKEINNKKVYEIIKGFIMLFMILTAVVITLTHKISINKNKIGILYSIGFNKKQIKKRILLEFMSIVIIAIIINSIKYLKTSKFIYVFFLNENIYSNLAIAILTFLVIIITVIVLSVNNLDKYTPKELLEEVRE